MKSLLLFSALKMEAHPVIRRLNLKKASNSRKIRFFQTTNKGITITLVLTGVGIRKSAIAANSCFRIFQPDLALNFGSAGSLISKLNFKTAFLPETFNYKRQEKIFADHKIHHTLKEICKKRNYFYSTGNLLTSDKSISQSRLKRSFASIYQVQAVDMEAYQQAYSAFINGVPFASFKVISDNANFLATLQFFWHISKNGNIFAEIIGDYISLLS